MGKYREGGEGRGKRVRPIMSLERTMKLQEDM